MKPITNNKAFQSAYKNGSAARMSGKSRLANPYLNDKRTHHGFITFARTFRNYWWEGWDDANRETSEQKGKI